MEFLIGALLTLFSVVIFSRKVSAENKTIMPVRIRYSQSYTYDLLSPVLPYILPSQKDDKITQSTKHDKKSQIRVILTKDEAYWISSQKLYVANIIDGVVDEESAKTVDTMSMDKVELDKMAFIVEQLTEGLENDNSNPGD